MRRWDWKFQVFFSYPHRIHGTNGIRIPHICLFFMLNRARGKNVDPVHLKDWKKCIVHVLVLLGQGNVNQLYLIPLWTCVSFCMGKTTSKAESRCVNICGGQRSNRFISLGCSASRTFGVFSLQFSCKHHLVNFKMTIKHSAFSWSHRELREQVVFLLLIVQKSAKSKSIDSLSHKLRILNIHPTWWSSGFLSKTSHMYSINFRRCSGHNTVQFSFWRLTAN